MYLSDMRERFIFCQLGPGVALSTGRLPYRPDEAICAALSGGASRDEIHLVTHVTLEELFRLQVCFRLLETLKGILMCMISSLLEDFNRLAR